MPSEHSLPLDLSRVEHHELVGTMTYVVIQGYQPGITNKLGAVLVTHGIDKSVVFRFSSEEEALSCWRQELSSGNSVACLGTASPDERLAYVDKLYGEIEKAANGPAGYWERIVSSRLSTTPTTLSIGRDDKVDSQTSNVVAESKNEIKGVVKLEAGHVSQEDALADSFGRLNTEDVPVNYAPPEDRGESYQPDNAPFPLNAVRNGNWAWYVVMTGKHPGIYASWADVKASNRGAARDPYNKGFTTYQAALDRWLQLRNTGGIRQLP